MKPLLRLLAPPSLCETHLSGATTVSSWPPPTIATVRSAANLFVRLHHQPKTTWLRPHAPELAITSDVSHLVCLLRSTSPKIASVCYQPCPLVNLAPHRLAASNAIPTTDEAIHNSDPTYDPLTDIRAFGDAHLAVQRQLTSPTTA